MLVSSALLAFVAASVSVSSVGASPVVARAGLPILVGNDDGCASSFFYRRRLFNTCFAGAEANIRAFYQELKKAEYNVRFPNSFLPHAHPANAQTLVSAPAYDESGTGSSTSTPSRLTSPGEFNSIPSGAPAEGHDSSDGPRLALFV
jgi:5'-nucleotidase